MHKIRFGNRIDARLFLNLLLSVLEEGVSIPLALKALAEDKRTSFYAYKLLNAIDNDVPVGKAVVSLSNELAQYEQILTVAERTGDIVPLLKNIVNELNENEEDKRNLTIVSIYPCVVCFIGIALSLAFYNYGVPYLNLITAISRDSIIMGILVSCIWLIFSPVILFFIGIIIANKNKFAYSFFRTMYFLSQSKISIQESLLLMLRGRGLKSVDRQNLAIIIEDIRNGISFDKSCQKIKSFDVYTNAWLLIAETNGKIQDCIEKIYRHYFMIRKKDKDILIKLVENGVMLIAGVYIVLLVSLCVIPVFVSLGNISF